MPEGYGLLSPSYMDEHQQNKLAQQKFRTSNKYGVSIPQRATIAKDFQAFEAWAHGVGVKVSDRCSFVSKSMMMALYDADVQIFKDRFAKQMKEDFNIVSINYASESAPEEDMIIPNAIVMPYNNA